MASTKRGGFFARLGCGCGTATPPRVLSPIQNRAAGAPELHAPRAAAKATRALSFDEPQGEVTDEGVTEHEAPLEGVQQQEEAAEAAAGIAADTEAAAKALDADAEDAEEDKGATMSHFNHAADDNTPDEADVAVMEACEAQEAADALVDDSDAEGEAEDEVADAPTDAPAAADALPARPSTPPHSGVATPDTAFTSPAAYFPASLPGTAKSVYLTPSAHRAMAMASPEMSPAVARAAAEAGAPKEAPKPADVALAFVAVAEAVASGAAAAGGGDAGAGQPVKQAAGEETCKARRAIGFAAELEQVQQYSPAASAASADSPAVAAAISSASLPPLLTAEEIDAEAFSTDAEVERGELLISDGFVSMYNATVGGEAATLTLFVEGGDERECGAAACEQLSAAVSAAAAVPPHDNVLRLRGARGASVLSTRVRSLLCSSNPDGESSEGELGSRDAWLFVRLCLDVARGMEHLHAYGVRHGHLTSAAVVAPSSEDEPATDGQSAMCMVAFAGLADARAALAGGRALSLQLESYRAAAPEDIERTGSGLKADVYQFALLMWELWCGAPPFTGLSAAEVALGVSKFGMRPRVPSSMPAKIVALMARCWARDADARPNFAAVVSELERLEFMPVWELYGDDEKTEGAGAAFGACETPRTPATAHRRITPSARPAGRRLRRALKLARLTPKGKGKGKKQSQSQKQREVAMALQEEGFCLAVL